MTATLRIMIIFLILVGQSFADEGVSKSTKSSVAFKGIGKLTTQQSEIITEKIKRTESKNKFKGKGITGKLMGKFFPKGRKAEIVNLIEANIYELNLKKKKCTVRPLIEVPDSTSLKGIFQSMKGDQGKYEKPEEEDNQIEIIASEFKVEKMDESRTLNNFICDKFWLNAYTRWKHKGTGQEGTDSLSTVIWMTPLTDEIRKAQEIEWSFTKSYLKELGMDVDAMRQDLLGSNWLEKFKQVKGDNVSFAGYANMAREMGKMDGYYPVQTHGKMYSIRPKLPEVKKDGEVAGETNEPLDVKKSFGRFGKKLFGKKKDKSKPAGPEPFLDFYTELLALSVTDLGESDLKSPYACKQK